MSPKSIAIVGISRNPHKIGRVILENLLRSKYKGKIYLVNPAARKIGNFKVYPSLEAIKKPIDLAIIALPAAITNKVVEQCGRLKIKNIIALAAGYAEVGNKNLERQLQNFVKKYKLNLLGPNCLGIVNNHNNMNTFFLPSTRSKIPQKGNVSFIVQSGANGSALLDLVASESYGVSKCISYGNAVTIDESDLLAALADDTQTKVICLYIEGVKDGKKFMRIASQAAKKKPVVVMKGGLTEAGSQATLSHTASLAGSAEIYSGVLKQCGVIQAFGIHELVNHSKVLEKCIKPKGRRVQIITNGGGFGILCTDSVALSKLTMQHPTAKTVNVLKKKFPASYVLSNPMDLTGTAHSKEFVMALEKCLDDKNSDIILLITLFQTPLVDTAMIQPIIKLNKLKKKPIIVVSMGSEYTKKAKQLFEQAGIPCLSYPENTGPSLKALCDFYKV